MTLQHYPNPFNTAVILQAQLSRNHKALTLDIFNYLGQLVRQYHIPAHQQNVRILWDGKNKAGKPVGSGTYWARLSSNNKAVKLLFLK